jgi:hypothetical protein
LASVTVIRAGTGLCPRASFTLTFTGSSFNNSRNVDSKRRTGPITISSFVFAGTTASTFSPLLNAFAGTVYKKVRSPLARFSVEMSLPFN